MDFQRIYFSQHCSEGAGKKLSKNQLIAWQEQNKITCAYEKTFLFAIYSFMLVNFLFQRTCMITFVITFKLSQGTILSLQKLS